MLTVGSSLNSGPSFGQALGVAVLAPAALAGPLPVQPADFGPPLASLKAASRPVLFVGNACAELPAELLAAVQDKVALAERGMCPFTTKAAHVAGAALLLVIQDAANQVKSPPR